MVNPHQSSMLGVIFVEHSSSNVHVEHQCGYSGVKTIRAKQSYQRMRMDNGIFIQDHPTDS
jgi:hypothetical protein